MHQTNLDFSLQPKPVLGLDIERKLGLREPEVMSQALTFKAAYRYFLATPFKNMSLS